MLAGNLNETKSPRTSTGQEMNEGNFQNLKTVQK